MKAAMVIVTNNGSDKLVEPPNDCVVRNSSVARTTPATNPNHGARCFATSAIGKLQPRIVTIHHNAMPMINGLPDQEKAVAVARTVDALSQKTMMGDTTPEATAITAPNKIRNAGPMRFMTANRDRETPCGAPLPHHRAYGSRTRRFDE